MLAWTATFLLLGARQAAIVQAESGDTPGDVRRYGAVCNAEVDDTKALIRAGQSGLEVYIPPTLTCRVTGPLAAGIQPGQRWHGGGTIRTGDGSNFTVFSVAGKTDVTFDGLVGLSGTLGAAYGAADARFIEFIGGSHRGSVVNSRIVGFQQAVRVHGSTDITIDNNDVIKAYGWGISIQTGANRAKVTGNRISGTVHEHGIYVSGSPSLPVHAPLLQSNLISDSRHDGIKLTYTDDAVVASNATSGNGGQGIYVTVGTNRASVHDNVSFSNFANGILVFDETTKSDNNSIQHNMVRGNRGHGIVVSSSGDGAVSHTRVTNNEITANGQDGAEKAGYGVVVSGPGTTSQTIIEGNRLNEQSIGVYVVGGKDTIIGPNTFENCRRTVVESPADVPK